MVVLLIIIWILITLLVSCLAGVLGKKYGLEYPIAMFGGLVVMANIFASKIVMFGSFSVPAGVIVFSMTFLITDILSEQWGKKIARKTVWAGFYVSVLLIISVYIVRAWPAAPYALDFSKMFSQVLALSPRITLAGFVAYLISQHHDVWAFDFWKRLTKGKYLWLRNNASTIVSQLIDSVIFITIAFYGIFPILPLIIGQWVVKVIIALLDTPFMYFTMWLMKKG